MSFPRYGYGATVPVGPPTPAIPRQLPLSPDDRLTGQGAIVKAATAIPAKGVVTPVVEAVSMLSGSLAVIPDDDAVSPPVSGAVSVRVSPPGGGEWSRTVDVPRWGVVLNIPAGRVEVNVVQMVAGIAWRVASAQGIPTTSRVTAGALATLPATGTLAVAPPRFAQSLRITVFSGSIAFPTATSAPLAAPVSITVPAQDGVFLGVAANSEFSFDWEVFS